MVTIHGFKFDSKYDQILQNFSKDLSMSSKYDCVLDTQLFMLGSFKNGIKIKIYMLWWSMMLKMTGAQRASFKKVLGMFRASFENKKKLLKMVVMVKLFKTGQNVIYI